jgi:hypothetical protein
MLKKSYNKMLTKTQARIMEIFAANIAERFSIKGISKIIGKDYSLVHRSIKPLIVKNLLVKDKQRYLSLNYKENITQIACMEALRTQNFFQNKQNKTIELFVEDTLKAIKDDFFIMLIFGSAVEQKKVPRDVDILFIVDDNAKINKTEKIVHNIALNFSAKFDINVISQESVYEMFSKRDQTNVMNETLNKHLIVFGAENYYRMLKNAR